MKAHVGLLVEDQNRKLSIVKIDNHAKKVILEDTQSKQKIEMTFSYFASNFPNVELDNRSLLHD